MSAKRITVADTLGMSVDERIEFIQDVWDSLSAFPDAIPVSAEHRKIIAERLRTHRRNPSAVIPWDEIKAEFLGDR